MKTIGSVPADLSSVALNEQHHGYSQAPPQPPQQPSIVTSHVKNISMLLQMTCIASAVADRIGMGRMVDIPIESKVPTNGMWTEIHW